MSWWFLLLAVACLVGGMALYNSLEPVFHGFSTLLFGAALACGIGLIGGQIYQRRHTHFVWPGWSWRWLGIFIAIVLSFIAADLNFHAAESAPDRQLTTTLVWVSAVIIAVIAAWPGREDRSESGKREPIARWEVLGLIGLVVLAFALRAFELEHIPGIVLGDETKYGVAAKFLTDNVVTKPFTTGSDGHWNLYLMIPAVFIQIFGATVTAMRLPSVIAGTLSIVATYAVVRQLWGRRAGFIAAALLAAYHHHLHYSRIGFNSIDDPLMTMTTLACLWLAWKTGRRSAWLMAALAIGLSQYFFVGGRLVLLEVGLLGLFWLITNPRRVRAQAFNLTLAIGVFLCVVLPIVYFIIIRPDDYMGSLNAKNIFLSGWLPTQMQTTQQTAGQVLMQQASDVIFSVAGGSDEGFYWNQAMLTPIMAVLAIAALIYFVRHPLDERHFWILSSLTLLFIFGGVLMVSPTSGSHRLVGSDPLLYIAIAVLLDRALSLTERYWRRPRLVAVIGVTVVALLMAGDLRYYFHDYINDHLLDSPDIPMQVVHQYLIDYQHQHPEEQPLRIVCVGFNSDYCGGSNLQYFVPQLLARAVITTDVTAIASVPATPERQIVIINSDLTAEVQHAQERYAPIERQEHYGPRGNLVFVSYEIPPGS